MGAMAFGIPVGADALIGPFHRLPSTTRPAAAKREAIQCDDHPRRPGHYPPRDGSIDLAEGDSVPEGQPKSEQAPIRRPTSRGGPLHRSAHKRLFLFHRARRILFLGKTKRGPRRAPRGGERRSKGAGAVFAAGGNGAERTLRRRNGGRIPRRNGPLREQNPPWPTSGGPSSPKAGGLLRSASPRPAPADSASIP